MKIASMILLTILTAGCGYKTASTPMTATPNIATLTPNNTAAGAPAFTLTVAGTAFGSASVVVFNGVLQPTTFVSATQVTAMIPGTAVANAGAIPVLVRVTTNGQYGQVTQNSNPVDFTVN
jgi:IPT/TIG domain